MNRNLLWSLIIVLGAFVLACIVALVGLTFEPPANPIGSFHICSLWLLPFVVGAIFAINKEDVSAWWMMLLPIVLVLTEKVFTSSPLTMPDDSLFWAYGCLILFYGVPAVVSNLLVKAIRNRTDESSASANVPVDAD